MSCPICSGTIIGKIGINQYYCWECYVEFSMANGQVKIYKVELDGSLVSVTGTENDIYEGVAMLRPGISGVATFG